MSYSYYDITLALAGINQSARLVQQLAHQGELDQQALKVILNSIIKIDAPSTCAVFGKESDLQLGLKGLLSFLNSQQPQPMSTELMRYSAGLMVLERRLAKSPSALDELSRRIAQVERQLIHFAIDSEPVIKALADIYVDVISPLGPKIKVTGSPDVLQQDFIQAKVRAALLGGIRSAVLWRQIGGTRWQLFFSRKRIVTQAQDILANCSI